jgi:V/A-type H+-transporting ATPase subunit C
MKSRLLSRRDLAGLAEAANLQGLIGGLSKTAYRKPVETALARTSGMACISIALREDLETALGKIRRFYIGQAGEMVDIVLRVYDAQNLKAILRGVSKQVSPPEILSATMPVGELTSGILAELARALDPRSVIDLLATMALPFAHPLLRLRAERPGAGILEMETALEKWHYQEAFNYLRAKKRAQWSLSAALKLDADLDNLLTVLRFALAPEERTVLHEWLGSADLTLLFVGPGRLSSQLLLRAGNQETVEEAVEVLAGTVYEGPLREGLSGYASSGRISDLEKQLQKFRLAWMSALIGKDPLGVGVLLGYLALKVNEVSNIRWIARGINSGLDANGIRQELVYTG